MELVGILWDAATCLFGCGKIHAAYVYKLKENLESLEGKCNQLRNSRADVLRKIEDMERMGEMRRTDEVNDWLEEADRLHGVERRRETTNIVITVITGMTQIALCA